MNTIKQLKLQNISVFKFIKEWSLKMKKLIILSSLTLLLAACSDNQDQVDDNTTSQVEESTTNSEKEIRESDFLGEYLYESDNKSSTVKFEKNGTLRFLDNSGNKRYSLRESSSRIVIDGEYYLIRKNDKGYDLMSIDENSERTNNDVLLVKQ